MLAQTHTQMGPNQPPTPHPNNAGSQSPLRAKKATPLLNISQMNFWFHAVQSNFNVTPGVQLKNVFKLKQFTASSNRLHAPDRARTSEVKLNK